MTVPELGPRLLALPAGTAARLMARGYLLRVLETAARVEIRVEEVAGPGAAHGAEREHEAVHDLRVALRRLRSWLRAWRPHLENTVRRSSERRLQRLSRLAGVARDLEVQRSWLLGRGVRRAGRAAPAVQWLERRVEAEYRRALRDLAKAMLTGLGPAAARLDQELRAIGGAGKATGHEATMAAAMALSVESQAGKVARRLGRARRIGQVAEAHAARIAVKRFRYLLDSLGRHSPNLRAINRFLVRLQDHLGELHDAQVLLSRLRAGGPSRRALAALRALVRRRVRREFQLVLGAIRGPDQARALAATERVTRRLRR